MNIRRCPRQPFRNCQTTFQYGSIGNSAWSGLRRIYLHRQVIRTAIREMRATIKLGGRDNLRCWSQSKNWIEAMQMHILEKLLVLTEFRMLADQFHSRYSPIGPFRLQFSAYAHPRSHFKLSATTTHNYTSAELPSYSKHFVERTSPTIQAASARISLHILLRNISPTSSNF